jgi:hypothetical protein
MEELTKRKFQFLILEIAASYQNCFNKLNLLGKPHSRGDIERKLDRELTIPERIVAARAFDELVTGELLQSDYADMVNPENWVALTDLGRRALQRQALDSMDEALQAISPKLVELRDGMWEGLASNRTNSLQQASSSARELIDQTLKMGAPSDLQTRRDRVKHIYCQKSGVFSESELKMVNVEIDCLLKLQDQIIAAAHTRGDLDRNKIEGMLTRSEILLKALLLP